MARPQRRVSGLDVVPMSVGHAGPGRLVGPLERRLDYAGDRSKNSRQNAGMPAYASW